MLSIRNQLICLSIAMLLMTCFQPDQVNGQIKKNKLLKGLMGASLLKLFKSKKGVLLPIPLPLPLPIDWHTQAGLLSKNNPVSHVSHQPYPTARSSTTCDQNPRATHHLTARLNTVGGISGQQSGIQMSPIEFSEYQNAIAQALSSGNSYLPSSGGSTGNGYSTGQTSGQTENSAYNSNSASGSYDSSSGSTGYDSSSNSASNGYDNGSNSPSNGYDGSSGSNDDSSNYGSNAGPASYGVAGVNQNDEYNAYQVSNSDNNGNTAYRAAASSINPNTFNPNYNLHFNNQQNSGYNNYAGNQYVPNYNQFNNLQNEYSQTAPQNNEQQVSQYNYQNGSPNQASNYEDNSGSASSNSYIATSGQQATNNYIPLRSVPIYHHHVQQQSTYQQSNNQQANQPNYASNGWVALD